MGAGSLDAASASVLAFGVAGWTPLRRALCLIDRAEGVAIGVGTGFFVFSERLGRVVAVCRLPDFDVSGKISGWPSATSSLASCVAARASVACPDEDG
jgi:hypothetical protein